MARREDPDFPQSPDVLRPLGIPVPGSRRAEVRRGERRWPCLSPAPSVWCWAAPPWALAAGCPAPRAGSRAAGAHLENPRIGSISGILDIFAILAAAATLRRPPFGGHAPAATLRRPPFGGHPSAPYPKRPLGALPPPPPPPAALRTRFARAYARAKRVRNTYEVGGVANVCVGRGGALPLSALGAPFEHPSGALLAPWEVIPRSGPGYDFWRFVAPSPRSPPEFVTEFHGDTLDSQGTPFLWGAIPRDVGYGLLRIFPLGHSP